MSVTRREVCRGLIGAGAVLGAGGAPCALRHGLGLRTAAWGAGGADGELWTPITDTVSNGYHSPTYVWPSPVEDIYIRFFSLEGYFNSAASGTYEVTATSVTIRVGGGYGLARFFHLAAGSYRFYTAYSGSRRCHVTLHDIVDGGIRYNSNLGGISTEGYKDFTLDAEAWVAVILATNNTTTGGTYTGMSLKKI